MDYKTYYCPKCKIKKHVKPNEKFDFKCKSCGENMKYEGVVRSSYNKETSGDCYRHKEVHHSINTPKCPKCGSTAISTGARGVNNFWGFLGASQTVNRCANCGHTWKPRG